MILIMRGLYKLRKKQKSKCCIIRGHMNMSRFIGLVTE